MGPGGEGPSRSPPPPPVSPAMLTYPTRRTGLKRYRPLAARVAV